MTRYWQDCVSLHQCRILCKQTRFPHLGRDMATASSRLLSCRLWEQRIKGCCFLSTVSNSSSMNLRVGLWLDPLSWSTNFWTNLCGQRWSTHEGPAWSNVCAQGQADGMIRSGDMQVNQRRRVGDVSRQRWKGCWASQLSVGILDSSVVHDAYTSVSLSPAQCAEGSRHSWRSWILYHTLCFSNELMGPLRHPYEG